MSTPICSVGIVGGLGNKLFQLAHMYGYAKKHGYEARLHPQHISRAPHERASWVYFRRDAPLMNFTKSNVTADFRDACAYRDYSAIAPPGNIMFHGFFQSEKYFKHCSDYIFAQFRCPPDARADLVAKYGNNAAFLHIRCGDNIGNRFHFIDLESYYKRALAHFPADTMFYIFSDDIAYCQRSYGFLHGIARKTFITERNEVNSLWLMSLCRLGGICANSTFSWWGGWLALRENPGCTVIYPDRQFPHDEIDFSDILPEGFIEERTGRD
jgi:hypothetical protein